MTASCRSASVALAALVLGLGGCSNARMVTTDTFGGVVAIPRNNASNRKAAEELMKEKCPQGYVIDSEREVVIGHTSEQEVSGNFVRTINHPVTEYQIRFRAKDAPPPPYQPAVVRAPAPAGPPAVVQTSATGPNLPPQPIPVAAP
jgi:hypothetical protein